MNRHQKKYFFSFLLLFISTCYSIAQNTGSVIGVVLDKETREPLIGAAVLIEGSTLGTSTDLDGNFAIVDLRPGSYTVLIKYVGYAPIRQENVVVTKGQSAVLNIDMVTEGLELQSVVIVGQRKQNTDLAMLQATKTSLLVQSGISSQQITRTQDRDAAEVIRRVPGISLTENKFVTVRGLAQRYNNVWINNAAVPSSEADTRAFSFDLIPSSQMDNLVVIKSQAPELPADFSGGFIKMSTKDVPDQNSFSVSVGGSVNDKTHFRDFYYNPGSGTDFLGFDDGKRSFEGSYLDRLDVENSSDVDAFTKNGFNNDWSVKKKSPFADLRLSTSWNHRYDLENGKRFAVISTLNYTNSYTNALDMVNSRYGIWNTREDAPEYVYNYTDNVYANNVRLGAMLNLTYLPNEQDKYEFKNIFNQLGQDKYTNRSGYQFLSQKYIQEKQEYFYSSRSTYSGQVSGTYNREASKFDWNIGYAYADKNQPDRRIINREENTFTGDAHEGEMFIDQNEIERIFYRLNEHIGSAGINYQKTFDVGSLQPILKAGAYSEMKNRDYKNRAFTYQWSNNANLPTDFRYQDVVNEILIPANWGSDKIYINENTNNTNNYKGKNYHYAGYLGINVPVNKFDIYAGVRYENNDMRLTSYTSYLDFRTEERKYKSSDFFPSLNMTYKMNDQHQLRLAYGASINRPEFREVSTSVYYDFDLFSPIKGNKDLKIAHIQNMDLRYEFYPNQGEAISVALFYKHFKNPIEWTYIEANSGDYTFTFTNAKGADNYGIEVDIKKTLDFIGLPNFSLNFNGALIKSKVQFEEDTRKPDRQMQGQSPYLINTGLFYQHAKHGVNAGILYNRIGKRIIGVGRVVTSPGTSINNDIPDSYEMPRNAIDLTFSKKIAQRWEVKASARDILGEKITFKQFPRFEDDNKEIHKREQTTKQYSPGRSFIFSLSYTI
ncbi:TonB-dependent receptor [Parabacteroides sp. Marseille-P3160]|uniref:TonB-dependent receptor n=1 Tax=Parabacteroides sp. Marseille-P3160 TaxID=1917887 RepID=UPI0009BA4600|nr:TonB-dependent receptor [Parabacteroides sp. Marseille-P3160]